MAALADCMTSYGKEALLLWEYHNITPVCEKDAAAGGFGSNYVWAATSFALGLHTADPGEAGTLATNAATYTGYAVATLSRGVGFFTLSGSGTMTPQMSPSVAVSWPTNPGAGQAMNAVSIAMVYSAVQYPIMRDNAITGAPVTIGTDEKPTCPAGSIFLKRR